MNLPLRRSALAIGLIGAVALAGCQSGTDASPSVDVQASAAASATAAPPVESVAASVGGETSVFDLAIGDCFSVIGEQADSVLVIDCGEPHLFEVFALIDHEAGDGEGFPGEEAIGEYGDEECRPPFTDYVGHDYETSAYWITTLTPSAETWAEGDREIVCTLRLGEGGEETIGSAEGSGQ
jgi:Septum formation